MSTEHEERKASYGLACPLEAFVFWGGDPIMEEQAKRKLTAILSADVKGYSRLMADDEEATVRTINAYRDVMTGLIEGHRGRVVDAKGDNVLAEFSSVVDAVRCSVQVQKELTDRNCELPEHRRMEFRIGINLGDVIEEQGTIYGNGVNVAARLEGLADGGGICISGTTFDHVKNRISVGYEYRGKQSVKNVPDPVRVYKVLLEPEAAGKVIGKEEPRPRKKRWAAIAVFAVLVVVAGGLIWNFYLRPDVEPASVEKMAYPLPDKPSIAVMPFLNMTGDSKQDFFIDGLSEGIITALAKVPQLFVIGRDTTFSYKGQPVKAKQVSEELGVQYVLEGSVQKAGDNVRITAQLIDTLKGYHLWAERYDRELKDVFAVQDEITKRIITAFHVKLTHGEWGSIASKGTENLDAYLKSQEAAWCADQSTRQSLERGRRLSKEAIALDPKFPHAYHVLGNIHMIEALSGFSKNPRESLALANKMQLKAIELDDSFAAAHAAMGFSLLMLRKYDQAIAEAEKAYQLAPGSSSVLYWYGTVLTNYGRPQEAVPILKEVLRLEPKPMNSRLRSLSAALRDSGHYEEAIEWIKKAIQREPDSIVSQLILTSTYAYAGKVEEARAAAKEILRINPKFSIEQFMRGSPLREATARERFAKSLKTAGLPEKPPLPLPDKPSIAVLPFVNMSGDPEQEYFSDGLTDEIITALSKSSRLFVIARESVFSYKGKHVKVKQVGRELGVRYVLEGSVRKSEDRVRITAQLIDAVSEKHLWAERYDRPLGEIFAVQDGITLAIARAMQVSLTDGEQARLIGKGTKNLVAYLKAKQAQEQFYLMNRQGSLKAKEFAKEAIALDPKYAFPYTTLANAHMLDVWFNFSESHRESMKLAADAAQKALALDSSDPMVYSTLTNLYVMQRQYDKAIASAERDLEISPGGGRAHLSMGIALLFACRFGESITFFEQAVRLNPYPPDSHIRLLGTAYRAAGRYDESLSAYKKALQLNPNNIFTHLGLASVYVSLGRIQDARAEAKEVLRIHPKFSLDYFAKTLSLKEQSTIDEFVATLRKAGLK